MSEAERPGYDAGGEPGASAGQPSNHPREGGRDGGWDAAAVRALRERLGLTQAGLAERLGTRQQTVSEWETGASTPRRMSRRLLRMVAEEAGVYDARPHPTHPGRPAHRAGPEGED